MFGNEKHPKQTLRKLVAGHVKNEAPGGRKYEQKWSKMKAKWLQNAPLEASGRALGANPASRASPEPSRRGSGRARGSQKIRCWQPGGLLGRKVGRFHPPGGSPGGSRRGSGRSFWEDFSGKASWHEKSNIGFCIFLKLILHLFFCCFWTFGAAPARRRNPENIKNVFVFIVLQASAPFSRGTKNT